jgi:hypothetical protein
MTNNRDINIRLIIHVAKCLGDLRKKVDCTPRVGQNMLE